LPLPPFFETDAGKPSTPRNDEENGNGLGDEEKDKSLDKDPAVREKRHRVNSYYKRRMSQALMSDAIDSEPAGTATTGKSRRNSESSNTGSDLNSSGSGTRRTRRSAKEALSISSGSINAATSGSGSVSTAGSGSRKLSTSTSGRSLESLESSGARRGSSSQDKMRKESKDKDKEFLRRWLDQLPDLSFMLSSTLAFPSSSLAVTLPPSSPSSSSLTRRRSSPFLSDI
jgi:hypothetical protein